MGNIRGNTGSRNEGRVRPYYEEVRDPSPSWRAEVEALVGFDVPRARRNLVDWLKDNGFLHRDARGNAVGFDPSQGTATTKLETKACAAFKAIVSLMSLEKMWGAERVAQRRWARSLDELMANVRVGIEGAEVRQHEDHYFLNHCSGHSREVYGKRADQTAHVLTAARALVQAAEEARDNIVQYRHDSLIGATAEGRPGKTWLGYLERGLQEAGFALREIATLTADGQPARGGEDRVRKRIASANELDAEREGRPPAAAQKRTGKKGDRPSLR